MVVPAAIVPIAGFNEPFSAISHMVGIVAVVALAWPLLRQARGGAGRVVSVAIFLFSAAVLLSMSMVYHMLSRNGNGHAVLLRLDHAAIFALIAGTFTPIHAILFRGWWRWGVLGLIWTLAATGITLKTIFIDSIPEWMGLGFFLAMGWIGLFSGIKIARRHGLGFVMPLIWGGVAYTVAAACDFARWPILIPGVVEAHELFHIGVLAGLGFHAYFIWKIAALRPPEARPAAPRPEHEVISAAAVRAPAPRG